MIRPKIGIDWDDVTAPFNSIAIQMANEANRDLNPPLTLEDITSWENTGRSSVIKEFYLDPALYAQQAPTQETIAQIRELEKVADVFFITAVHPDFMGYRAKQIRDAFPELGCDRIILGAAKYLVQFDIVLDDNPKNVLDSPAKFAVLYRKPWNRHLSGLLSVTNMGEFVTLVKHIIGLNNTPAQGGQPKFIALVGPSCTRKNEIAQRLVHEHSFCMPVTYTDNPQNENAQYVPCFNDEEYMERTAYAGFRYGTKKADIEAFLDRGQNVVLPLDMCGAIGMRQNLNCPVIIVYTKRCKSEIISGIVQSKCTSEEKTLRLLSLDAERKNQELADVVVNVGAGSLDDAVNKILSIL